MILELDGERFEFWSRGRAQQLRVREWRGGEWIAVSGSRGAIDDPSSASSSSSGRATSTSAIRLPGHRTASARRSIERAATHLSADDGALFLGLVVGDDRDQPREMIERSRTSGLSHLKAVSGQNVCFLLAAAGPLLRRLRPWMRWAVTIGLIAWFVTLTRYGPSIVRAGAMAGLSATAFVLGRERSPVRILAVAVTGLVLVDPLLVWSVGFWLSVGATLGVSGAGPWIAARLGRFSASGSSRCRSLSRWARSWVW